MKAAPRGGPMKESSNEARRQETSGEIPCHRERGSICEKKLSTGTSKENPSPRARPGSVRPSGSRWQSASVRINPVRRKDRTQALAVSSVNPKCRKLAVKSTAVSNSTIASHDDMAALHPRHSHRRKNTL